MAINLLNIQPHKVSTDLSGYITYIYGAPKTGKTTLATQMESSLLLAFEPGYRALPGVYVQDVTSWTEMRQIYRELKKAEVKQMYKAIIIDTIDIAADRCKKYICTQCDIEDLGDLDFGKGWTKFKDEFNEIFRGLSQMGYAVFFLGHHKEVQITNPQDNTKAIYIRPNLSGSIRTTITGMADIYGYSCQKYVDQMSTLTLRSTNGLIDCGSRFKYMPNEIVMSYDNLVDALNKAIEKEAAENGNQFVTKERAKAIENTVYDYEALIKEFNNLTENISDKQVPLVISTIDKYLGKGKKISETIPEQAELIFLINEELKTTLN